MGFIAILLGLWLFMVILVAAAGRRDCFAENMRACNTACAAIFCVAVLVLALAMGITTMQKTAGLEAYFHDNAPVYHEASEAMLGGVQVSETGRYIIDAANLAQIDSYRRTVTVERDAALDFNRRLRTHRAWEDSFLFGLFWVDVEPGLQPLTITGS